MVAGEHSQGKGSGRLFAPRLKLLASDMILCAAKSGDGTIERQVGCVPVCLAEFEIRAQERENQAEQFRVFKHLCGRAAQAAQVFYKFRLRQVVRRAFRAVELERAAAGDEQVRRSGALLRSEQAC